MDWDTVKGRKRAQQIRDNKRENSNQMNYVWNSNKCLIITSTDKRKGKLLKFKHKSLYQIIKVNDNGTVKLKARILKKRSISDI